MTCQAAVIKAYIKDNIKLMADGQLPFPYTESQLQTLTMYISSERLQMYIASVRLVKDPVMRLRQAIKLYEKNTLLSEAMYTVMQGFEVTFRNAIHNRLTDDHKTPWWFDTFELLTDEKDSIAQAKRTIAGKPQPITP